MRYLALCVLVLLPSLGFADDDLPLRPLDAISADALHRAMERSATARALVKRLEASNVIVHIESSRSLPLGLGGTTRFVVYRGGYRYLRISLNSTLPSEARAAILGHELQHACEVADSDANDVTGLRTVFEHQGRRNGDFFETEAAIETERNVRLELRTSRALQAEPVAKFDH